MNKLTSTAVACTLLAASAAWAGGDQAHGASPMLAAQASTAKTDGEVRKVDKENKKITLKHGEIKNLGMPGMTMVFLVKDPAVLDKVQAGDKVRFTAEKAEGGIVVTALEAAK